MKGQLGEEDRDARLALREPGPQRPQDPRRVTGAGLSGQPSGLLAIVEVLSIILDWGWAATVIGLTIFVVLGLVAMALGRRGAAAR